MFSTNILCVAGHRQRTPMIRQWLLCVVQWAPLISEHSLLDAEMMQTVRNTL